MSKIVLIDDDPFILESLEEILSLDNHTIIATKSGWEALDYIKNNKNVDLIISDIEMPEIKGYEILENLKSDMETAIIPFIFLSGLDKEHHIRRGMTLGADDYITKPFDSQTILEAVKSRIEKNKKIEKVIKSKLQELSLSISKSLPHELLTPLNGIMAPLQMLMNDFDNFTKEEIQELHRVIFFCSTRLKNIASNFLFVVELSNRKKIQFSDLPILEGTDSIINHICSSLSDYKNRKNDISLDLNNYDIRISEVDFRKIFEELISNALKFSTNGSKIEIKSKTDSNKVVYEITDSGKGMTIDQIQKVSLLQQFDRKKFEQQGLGLGLYIVKKLCDLNNIELNIESELSHFTKVNLSFQKI